MATSCRRKLVSLSLTIASKAEKDNRFVHLGAVLFLREITCVRARLTFGKGVKCDVDEGRTLQLWLLILLLLRLLLLLGMAFW